MRKSVLIIIPTFLILTACTVDTGSKSVETPKSSTKVDAPAETTETTDSSYTPKISDFKLKFRSTSKQCFGEAGCNLEGKVDFAEIDPSVPKEVSVTVTFVINGAEDTTSDSIEVVDGKYDPVDVFFSTKSSGTKVTVVVTDVS